MPRKTAKRKAVPAAASAAKKQVKNAGKAANAPEPVIPQNNVAIAAPVLNLTQRKAEVVFSFDTTFSMFPCLTQVSVSNKNVRNGLLKPFSTCIGCR